MRTGTTIRSCISGADMADIDVELKGVRELAAKLNAGPGVVQAALQVGVDRMAEKIRQDSQRVTPKKTGALARSARTGRVGVPQGAGAEITFGGGAQFYAPYVHEAPNWWRWTTPGTGPKFLENTLKRWGTPAGVTVFLVPEIRKALRRMCGAA